MKGRSVTILAYGPTGSGKATPDHHHSHAHAHALAHNTYARTHAYLTIVRPLLRSTRAYTSPSSGRVASVGRFADTHYGRDEVGRGYHDKDRPHGPRHGAQHAVRLVHAAQLLATKAVAATLAVP